MSNTAAPARHINPDCHACNGTGTDAAFGGNCAECEIDAGRAALIAAAYSGIPTDPRTDRAYTPGERLDGRTFGGSTRPGPRLATDRQVAFLRKLIAEAGARGHDAFAEIADGADFDSLTAARASKAIDALQALKDHDAAETAAAPTTSTRGDRPNRYGGDCVDCGRHVAPEAGVLFKDGGWKVAHRDGECPTAATEPEVETAADVEVPDGHYAIDSTGDNDLAFYRVDNGGRYGVSVRLIVGGHSDSWVVRRNVPGIIARIAAAGVETARQRYAAEIGSCWVCNRTLTDEESRRLGIGPDCRKRHG